MIEQFQYFLYNLFKTMMVWCDATYLKKKKRKEEKEREKIVGEVMKNNFVQFSEFDSMKIAN